MNRELSNLELKTLTNIGKNVKFVRRELLNLKLVEISEHTGVSRDVICRLEALASGDGQMGSGRVYPSISTVIKFCEGIGVTPAELLDKDFLEEPEIQDKILEYCKDFSNPMKGLVELSEAAE
jgi:transcriptional regulator with XRE-family HTH domain